MVAGRTPGGACASGWQAAQTLRSLPRETFAEVRFDNGWTGRDILAHLAAIEWVYQHYVSLARLGATAVSWEGPNAVRWTAPADGPDVATLSAEGGVDGFNAREVAKRARASIDELIGEFERNRAATIAAVEGATDEALRTTVRSIGGVTGPLAAVLYRVAVEHVAEHVRDIAGGGGNA